ncbi:hypothetical protein ACFV9E_19060 [Streptomyces sp. NPDC059835]|uniref:hypothetical protein n=1 Tax=Streptomyces sp. NPDC059835 TaxID=3346967 RepID=UPI0036526579
MADGWLRLRIGKAYAVSLQQFDFEAGLIYVDRQVAQDGENEQARTSGCTERSMSEKR